MPDDVFSSVVAHPPAAVRAWHARAGLARLLPPWQRAAVVRSDLAADLGSGSLELRLGLAPGIAVRWVARHEAIPDGFADVQERGPFAAWRHEHRFLPDPAGCRIEDRIAWRAPLGGLLDGRIRRDLARTFAWRHARTRWDLDRAAGHAPATIAVSGAGGLVGRRLVAFLRGTGHRVLPLSRRGGDGIAYDPATGAIDAARLAEADAVVHLAGAPIARRWTAAAKAEIAASRVASTALIARTLAGLGGRPRSLVVASGIGWHGDTGERLADEDAPSGSGFLPEVCRDWEAAADPARAAGLRTVHLRLGLVLAADGGALAAMLPAFRLGLGGPIGGGRQWVSWIAIDDAVDLLYRAAIDPAWSGPVHAVAPEPLRQAEFAAAVAAAVHRPAWVPLPAPAVSLLLGGMGRSLLLDGSRIDPKRCREQGFAWRYPGLADALAAELGG